MHQPRSSYTGLLSRARQRERQERRAERPSLASIGGGVRQGPLPDPRWQAWWQAMVEAGAAGRGTKGGIRVRKGLEGSTGFSESVQPRPGPRSLAALTSSY